MAFSSLFFLFFKGILIGVIVSAPTGPVGILCIRRAIAGRYGLSLVTGLGAGLADTFYGAVAGFSLASISNFISFYDFYLRLFGGIFVSWMGISIFRTPLRQDPVGPREDTFFHALSSSFLVTISNPLVLLVFAAAFTVLGISPGEDSRAQGISLVSGVFVGASGWWVALSTFIFIIHRKLSPEHLLWINRASGVMVLGFGAYMLLSLI